MKKHRLFIILLLPFITFLGSCSNFRKDNNENENNPPVLPCNHELEEKVIEEGTCIKEEKIEVYCKICNEIIEIKEGNYGNHLFHSSYKKIEGYNNHFKKINKCEYCNKVEEVDEEIIFKDHHYELVSSENNNDQVISYTYKCLICDDYETYNFDLKDYKIGVNLDQTLNLEYYFGNEEKILIPSKIKVGDVIYNKIFIKENCFNSNLNIKKVKIIGDIYLSSNSFLNNDNLEKIDLSEWDILLFNNTYFNNLKFLKEIIFPSSLIGYFGGLLNCPNLKTLDFSNTSLEYIFINYDSNDEAIFNIESIILPPTLKESFTSTIPLKVKEIIMDSKDIVGTMYRSFSKNINYDENWFLDSSKYEKQQQFNVNVTLNYPDGNIETISFPYGENLYESIEFKDNKKYGWYFDKNCFDYFLGVVPSRDIVLYGLELDKMDEVFLNKNQFFFKPELINNKVILNHLNEVIGVFYYMLSNDIYSLEFEIKGNFTKDDLAYYAKALLRDSAYFFPYAGVNASFGIKSINKNYKSGLITNLTYEEYVDQLYDLDNVVYKEQFDYRKPFKDFDFKENNRDENFDEFKYKNYKYVKEGVTNPTIMSYMMSIGINVIPKKGSLAESTLSTYKDIARNIFNDEMCDYEKIVACNLYYNNYWMLDYDPRAAYNTNGNGFFSNSLELLPFHGTINCGSGVYIPRILYALEGIQIFAQSINRHVYGVVKLDGKYYISDHTQQYWVFLKDKSYNPLRGYEHLDYLWVEDTAQQFSHSTKNRIKILTNIAYYYPYIKIEKDNFPLN